MATASGAQPQMARSGSGRTMVERLAPEQFQFSDERRTLVGILLDIANVQVNGKETLQYTVRINEKGDRFTFLATYDLQRKLSADDIGHEIEVYYDGENKEIKTQGSPMKMFRVRVSKEKAPGF